MIKQIIDNIVMVIFPRRCDLCGRVIEFDKTRCDRCSKIKRIDGECCKYCGCLKVDCFCKEHKMEYKRIVAPFYYEDEIIFPIKRFKFSGYKELSVGMGHEIVGKILDEYSDIKFDAVTFVPLSKNRKRKRGYNQAQLLAKQISKELNIPCRDYLIKPIDNKAQRTVAGKNRKGNVFGMYRVKPKCSFEDETILIIDDVKTTGSTINECAKMLNLYGAKAVYAATFAITRKNRTKEK